jgi:hypothetical protein
MASQFAKADLGITLVYQGEHDSEDLDRIFENYAYFLLATYAHGVFCTGFVIRHAPFMETPLSFS